MTVPALLPSLPADREQLLWLTPSPLWVGDGVPADGPDFQRPRLVEYTTDDFVESFLEMLAGTGSTTPSALATLTPADGSGTASEPFVLYRPVHQRYYLVVGSLVCRQIGLPDRAVTPRRDRMSFVVRRLTAGGGEEAWLPASSEWTPADHPERLVSGEEQHPMHSEPIAAVADGPAASLLGLDGPGRRTLHYGYIPVAGNAAQPQPLADPVAALATETAGTVGDDPRLMEFRLRVAGPWRDIGVKAKPPFNLDVSTPSLYLLLDLRDWLQTYLPEVLDALLDGTTLPAGSKAEAVRAKLDISIQVDAGTKQLGDVLGDLAGYASLVHGVGDQPASTYDVSTPPGGLPQFVDDLAGTGSSDGGLVVDALTDSARPAGTTVLPVELAGQVVARVDDPAQGDRHVIRLVYEHDPCNPVVSKPSAVVRFAGTYDPDAPARPVRIELPDPKHLRRFNRGVAVDVPPSLRRMLDSVTPKILKEEGLGTPGGWSLGMICSFSLHIIMLVAFIVMFIFLILLNIVFWWLPFLKVCFPVPRKDSS